MTHGGKHRLLRKRAERLFDPGGADDSGATASGRFSGPAREPAGPGNRGGCAGLCLPLVVAGALAETSLNREGTKGIGKRRIVTSSRNRAIRCNPASTVKPGSRSGRSHDTAYPPMDEMRRKERQPAYVPVGNPPRPVFRKALTDSVRQQRTLTMHLRTSPLPISESMGIRREENGHPAGPKRQESIGTVVVEQDVGARRDPGSPRRRARSDASPAVTFLAGKHDICMSA